MKGFFSGIATALVTPFCKTGIDFSVLDDLVSFQKQNGIETVVLAGTTGEPSTMTDEETVSLCKHAVKRFKGKIRIIMGSGSNNTATAVRLAKTFEDEGADGLLAVTPYYNKCTKDGLLAHYNGICSAVKIPVIAYEVPSRTGVEISDDCAKKLADLPNFAGIKDARGDVKKFSLTLSAVREKCDTFSGDDSVNLPLFALGASGAVSVLSNVFPRETVRLFSLVQNNELAEAQTLFMKMLPVIESLFSSVNPIPVKSALSYLGFPVGKPRLPLTPLCRSEKIRLFRAVDAFRSESW